VALWVRSHWRADSLHYSSALGAGLAQTQDTFVSEWGSIIYARGRVEHRTPQARPSFVPGWVVLSDSADLYGDPRESVRRHGREWLGFGYSRGTTSAATRPVRGSYVEVIVPHWAVALVLGVLPGRWFFVWWRRRRRLALGRCAVCGYDLRATPDRCPECGAVPQHHPKPPHNPPMQWTEPVGKVLVVREPAPRRRGH